LVSVFVSVVVVPMSSSLPPQAAKRKRAEIANISFFIIPIVI